MGLKHITNREERDAKKTKHAKLKTIEERLQAVEHLLGLK